MLKTFAADYNIPIMKTPTVSILMPTYNRQKLLERAIASVFAQSYADFELIVVNDVSTDDTQSFLDELAKRDARVKSVRHEKNYYPDISRTLNEAISLARGRYIARLDDDDYWCDPDKLALQVAFLDAHPDHVIVGGGTIVIDDNDREQFRYFKLETDEKIRDKALFANPFTHSTVMFRRDIAQKVGGYGNYGNVEDWDLWLRMGLHGKFYNFQKYFVRYLLTEKSKTFIFKRSQSRDILRMIGLHRKEYRHFAAAYLLNYGQYLYSFFPQSAQKILHSSLSRMKRDMFSEK